jgi:hypothetical protein
MGTINSAKWSSSDADSKKIIKNKFRGHIMAPESREGTQLGHFFSKQGKFFFRDRIAKKLLQFLDKVTKQDAIVSETPNKIVSDP